MSQRQDNPGACDGKPPIRSPVMTVEPHWIDYNGHLNLAYYQVLFDRATDGVFEALGIGSDYAARRNLSMFALEVHICYLREIGDGERVCVDSQILDHDEKRIHIFQSLIHVDGEFVSATAEIMHLHVNLATRRATPFPDDRLRVIATCAAAHADLPRPGRAGRQIGIPQK